MEDVNGHKVAEANDGHLIDAAPNGYRRVSGVERCTGESELGIALRVIVGSPQTAVLWGLQLSGESATRAAPEGRIEPTALFALGIECLSMALQAKWQQFKDCAQSRVRP